MFIENFYTNNNYFTLLFKYIYFNSTIKKLERKQKRPQTFHKSKFSF